ncbi:hypothetical protein BH24CHL1_BH24CHL1_19180 [soil metagenome]
MLGRNDRIATLLECALFRRGAIHCALLDRAWVGEGAMNCAATNSDQLADKNASIALRRDFAGTFEVIVGEPQRNGSDDK